MTIICDSIKIEKVGNRKNQNIDVQRANFDSFRKKDQQWSQQFEIWKKQKRLKLLKPAEVKEKTITKNNCRSIEKVIDSWTMASAKQNKTKNAKQNKTKQNKKKCRCLFNFKDKIQVF